MKTTRSIALFLSIALIITATLTTGCTETDNSPNNQGQSTEPLGDTVKPTITGTNPKHGEKNIDPMPTITLDFSERMKMTVAQNNVMIVSPSSQIPIQEFDWEHSQKLKIHIKNNLAFGTTYTFEIRGLADEAGNLIDVYTLSFTIRSPTAITVILHEMTCHIVMDDWSSPDLYACIIVNEVTKCTRTYDDTYSAKPEYRFETEVDEYPEVVIIRIYDEDVSDNDYIGGIEYSGTYADHKEYNDNAIYVSFSVWYS